MSKKGQASDEIDLISLLNSIKKGFRNLLISFYHFTQFLLRNWIVILVLLIIGIALGYWKDSTAEIGKESSLILKVNLDDASYLYDVVEKLNRKIADRDSVFLKKHGLYDGRALIKGVELTPIIDLDNIARSYRPSDNRNLGLFFDNVQENTEKFNEEVKYKSRKQKAYIHLSHDASHQSIENFIAYLNSNKLLKKLHENYVKGLEDRIKKKEEMIVQIDRVIASMSNRESTSSEINFNSQSSAADLFTNKNAFSSDIYKAKEDLLTADNNIVVLNDNLMYNEEIGSFSKKKLIYPLGLIILFTLFIYLLKGYRHLAKIAN